MFYKYLYLQNNFHHAGTDTQYTVYIIIIYKKIYIFFSVKHHYVIMIYLIMNAIINRCDVRKIYKTKNIYNSAKDLLPLFTLLLTSYYKFMSIICINIYLNLLLIYLELNSFRFSYFYFFFNQILKMFAIAFK